MNVFIFGRSFGKILQVSLSGKAATAIGVVFAGSLCAAAFAGGYWYSVQTGSGVQNRQ